MYFITIIEKLDDSGKHIQFGDKRTCGFFKDREKAIETIRKNKGGLHHLIKDYEYVVMERIEEGVYPDAVERQWFQWDEKEEGFTPIDTPACVENVVNFAVG